jgi:hypothetical protein
MLIAVAGGYFDFRLAATAGALLHSMARLGTSRRFAAMQQYVGYRGHSRLWQAVLSLQDAH